jgi:hypothetical protein
LLSQLPDDLAFGDDDVADAQIDERSDCPKRRDWRILRTSELITRLRSSRRPLVPTLGLGCDMPQASRNRRDLQLIVANSLSLREI